MTPSRRIDLKNFLNIYNTYIEKFTKFDSYTNYRIQNLFIVTIGLSLIIPVITDLKGELLAAWVISLFMIFEQLSVKVNRYMVEKFTLSQMYKIGAVVHVVYTFSVLLYFINPLVMVLVDMCLAIVIMATFNTYTIMLNTHLSDNYPSMMTEFQIVRNSVQADSFLIGLALSTIVLYFTGIHISLLLFFIYNSIFTIRLLRNWKYFD